MPFASISMTGGAMIDPRPAPVDPYWLAHCEGFAVARDHGRVGVVEHLLYRSRLDRPDALVVISGRLRLRRVLVPTDHIASIDPRARSLAVMGSRHAENGAGDVVA
jgi:hypothetical protein